MIEGSNCWWKREDRSTTYLRQWQFHTMSKWSSQCGRGSGGSKAVWHCLVVSLDRSFGFILFCISIYVVAHFLHNRAAPESLHCCSTWWWEWDLTPSSPKAAWNSALENFYSTQSSEYPFFRAPGTKNPVSRTSKSTQPLAAQYPTLWASEYQNKNPFSPVPSSPFSPCGPNDFN